MQVLATGFGPTTEICPQDIGACTFIESKGADCFMAPCGEGTLFGEATVHQPAWREPSQHSLVTQLKRLHALRQELAAVKLDRARDVEAHVKGYTWYSTGTSMQHRIRALLEGSQMQKQ